MRHPVAVLIPTLALLLLLGAPFLHVRFNAPDASILPPDVRRGPRSTCCDGSSAKGSSRRSRSRSAQRTPRPGLTTLPSSTSTPDGSRRIRAIGRVDWPRRRRSSSDPRSSTSSCTAILTGRATGSSRRRSLPRQGRPDRVYAVYAVRPEPGRGAGARLRAAGTRPPQPRRRQGGSSASAFRSATSAASGANPSSRSTT